MGAGIRKYVDLEERYAVYGDAGYYIDPFIINMAIVDELKLSMSYVEIKKFIKKADITLTLEEIENFLVDRLKDDSKYYYEPYSLQYFKNYVSILKEKCETLFDILDDINRVKTEELTEEQSKRILDLDFHINENGDIYFADAVRLLDAIVYNVKNLNNKVKEGNNLETYLTFKESKQSLFKDNMFECELYPRKEVQIKDLYYACKNEFIALSDHQKEELEKERKDISVFWMNKVLKNSIKQESNK